MPKPSRGEMKTAQALRSAAIQLMKSAAMFDAEALSVVLRRTSSPPILTSVTNPTLMKNKQNCEKRVSEPQRLIEQHLEGHLDGGIERQEEREEERHVSDSEVQEYRVTSLIVTDGDNCPVFDETGQEKLAAPELTETVQGSPDSDGERESTPVGGHSRSFRRCRSQIELHRQTESNEERDAKLWEETPLSHSETQDMGARMKSSSEPDLGNDLQDGLIQNSDSIGHMTLGSDLMDCKPHPRHKNSPISTACRRAVLHRTLKLAAALWDHVTMDPLELGFRAGDTLEVTDWLDKDWWWGRLGGREGWFPAAFVVVQANHSLPASIDISDPELRMRVLEVGMDYIDGAEEEEGSRAGAVVPQDRARAHVVLDIIMTEREYVRHLRDVTEGYVERARRRTEMFSEEKISTIFGNLDQIFEFSASFLSELESCLVVNSPHTSELGNCFLHQKDKFEMYSEYCSNYPDACEELRILQRDRKYQQFFEACRLLQKMIALPLDGFLLTPAQKICRYPLQLKELLKYTPTHHPDHAPLTEALEAMKGVALLINERKRRTESLEQLVRWQDRISGWQGSDLLERSSELISSGELVKLNPAGGRSMDRVVFIFDHQLVFCKKDLLWRDLLVYKGRVDLDLTSYCRFSQVKELSGRFGFRLVESQPTGLSSEPARVYLFSCKTMEDQERWMEALEEERRRVSVDDSITGESRKRFKDKIYQGRLGQSSRRKEKFYRIKEFSTEATTISATSPNASTTGQQPAACCYTVTQDENHLPCEHCTAGKEQEISIDSADVKSHQNTASNKSTPVRQPNKKSSIFSFVYRKHRR